MLFLLSIVLVVVALILLILGFVAGSGLSLIYAAIVMAVLAGAVLVLSVLLDRNRPAPAADRPADLPPEQAPDASQAPEAAEAPLREAVGAPATTSAPPPPEEPPEAWAPEPAPKDPTTVAPAPKPDQAWPADPDAPEDQAGSEPAESGAAADFFPIADYDDLTVEEILPLLPQLYPEEHPVVEARERSTKNRAVILQTLADLHRQAAPEPAPAAPAGAPAPGADPAPDAAPAEPAQRPFPIEGYDSLAPGDIIPMLGRLEPAELAEVREREARGAARATVLAAIDRRIGRAASRPS